MPDGRNSYNLTADDVFGIPLAGEVINYDAVPENDNCVALYHFDGNIKDSSGAGSVSSFLEGSIPAYRESDSYGQCLYLSSTDNLSITLPQELEAPYTIEFRVNYGTNRTFTPASSFFAIRSFASSGKYTNELTCSISIPDPRNELAEYLYLYEEGVESWSALVPFLSFLCVDGSDSVERIAKLMRIVTDTIRSSLLIICCKRIISAMKKYCVIGESSSRKLLVRSLTAASAGFVKTKLHKDAPSLFAGGFLFTLWMCHCVLFLH